MGRKLMFRAWHKEVGKMLDIASNKSIFLWEDEGQPIVIMQYIGRNDIKGKPIYEGDIVRILYTGWPSQAAEDPRTLEQYLINLSHVGVIEYRGVGFCVNIKDCPDTLSVGEHGRIEVIGNAYETPELISKP